MILLLAALLAAPPRELLREFADFLAIPNLASDAANIPRNAEAVRAMFEKRGAATRVLTLEGAPPLVVADVRAPGAKKTIAFYAYYDGQPVDPSQWRTPPWTPVMRDAQGHEVDWTNALASLMTAAGHEPVRLPTMRGSVPTYLFERPNGTPVIGLTIANHDDNQHAANENIRLQNLWDGIEIFEAVFGGLR